MIIHHPAISSIMIFISLYLFPGVLVAQTASTRPMSEIISATVREQLDRKPASGMSGSAGTAERLPSNGDLPQRAKEAKAQHAHNPRPGEGSLPSVSRVTAEDIRSRNNDLLKKINTK